MALIEFERNESESTKRTQWPIELVQSEQHFTAVHQKPILGDEELILRPKAALISSRKPEDFLAELMEKAKSKDGIRLKVRK